jgi:heat-inducible transcriptional repressor
VLDQLLPANADDEAGAPRARVHVGVRGLPGFSGAGSGDPGPNPTLDPILQRAEPGLSLVACRVPITGRVPMTGEGRGPDGGPQLGPNRGPNRGVVALLGPARMDYAAMIPLVEYAARALAARMCA